VQRACVCMCRKQAEGEMGQQPAAGLGSNRFGSVLGRVRRPKPVREVYMGCKPISQTRFSTFTSKELKAPLSLNWFSPTVPSLFFYSLLFLIFFILNPKKLWKEKQLHNLDKKDYTYVFSAMMVACQSDSVCFSVALMLAVWERLGFADCCRWYVGAGWDPVVGCDSAGLVVWVVRYCVAPS
jgi:hypothetical protein